MLLKTLLMKVLMLSRTWMIWKPQMNFNWAWNDLISLSDLAIFFRARGSSGGTAWKYHWHCLSWGSWRGDQTFARWPPPPPPLVAWARESPSLLRIPSASLFQAPNVNTAAGQHLIRQKITQKRLLWM